MKNCWIERIISYLREPGNVSDVHVDCPGNRLGDGYDWILGKFVWQAPMNAAGGAEAAWPPGNKNVMCGRDIDQKIECQA
jgi:hypothetical protein